MAESTQGDNKATKSPFPHGGYAQDHGDWYVIYTWIDPVDAPERRALETLALQVCGNCNETFALQPAYDFSGLAWLQALLDLPHADMSPECGNFIPPENRQREW